MLTRRHLLGIGGTIIVSLGLAGCLGNGNDDDDDDPGEPDRFADFLADARGYDGRITDRTGRDRVTVQNGAGTDGFSFNPVALRIDTGATVVWEWTGRGGGHDVASVRDSDFTFRSDRTAESGFTFQHTFDQSGVALYVCQPHRGLGMKGGIQVV